ncbi:MAG: hypothetical protein K6F06_01105 [Bacteroidales bacterium]|nr:hypothetical protein [Bacteroidales bacterium]
MVYVEGVQKVHDTLSDAKTRLVVYIDSSRCSICGLNKLNRFEEYAALSESNLDFRIVILICPDSETRSSVEMDIEHRRFPFDVFIDYEGAFPRLNPNLPRKDIRFHCFLLDKNNIPILVGDPTISRQIGILFKEKYSESCLDK